MSSIRPNKPSFPFGLKKTPFDPKTGSYLPLIDTRVVMVFILVEEQSDALLCRDTCGNLHIVAKPYSLQRTPFDGKTVDGVEYEYVSLGERTADGDTQNITQPYAAGEQIVGCKTIMQITLYEDEGHDSDIVHSCKWTDLNNAGRNWDGESSGGTDTSIAFTNDSGEEIPPYAAMEVTNVSLAGLHTVTKPTNDGIANGYIIFNGSDAVAIGENGTGYHCTDLYKRCLINTDSDPVGNSWGTTNGQWYLTKDNSGFVCIGAEGGSVSVAWMRPFRDAGFKWTTPETYPTTEGTFPEEWYGIERPFTFIQYGEDNDDTWGKMKHRKWEPFNFRTNAVRQTTRISRYDNSVAGDMCHRSWAGWIWKPFESCEPSFDVSLIDSVVMYIETEWINNDLKTSQGDAPTSDQTFYIMMAPYFDRLWKRQWAWVLDDTLAADPAVSTTNWFVWHVDDKIGEKVRIYETDTGDDYTGETAYIKDTAINELFDPSGLGINFLLEDTFTLSPVVTADEENGGCTAVTATTITDSTKSWGVDSLVGRTVWRFGLPGIYWTITSNTATEITASGGTDIDDTISIGNTFTVGPAYTGTTVDTGTVTDKTSLTITDSSKSWSVDENVNKRLFRGSFNPLVPYYNETYWEIASNSATVLTADASGSEYYRHAVKFEDVLSQTYNADGNTNARIWYCESENGWKDTNLIPLKEVSTNNFTSAIQVALPLDEAKLYIEHEVGIQIVFVPKDFDKGGVAMHCAVYPAVLIVNWTPSGP